MTGIVPDITDPLANTGVPDPLGLAPPVIPGLVQTKEQDGFGGPTASREVQLDAEAAGLDTLDTLSKSFTSGGNYAYTLYKKYERAQIGGYGPDKFFDPDKFIDINRAALTPNAAKQIKLAYNQAEAEAILADAVQETRDKDLLQRRGEAAPLSTFVLQGLTGIVDIDTPIAIATGGAVNLMKGGNLFKAAVAGGVSQAAAAGIALEASTTGDWTEIPTAGLAGLAFGVSGAALARRSGAGRSAEELANESVAKAQREFEEFKQYGRPIEQRDIRNESFLVQDDVYGTRRRADAEIVEENAKPKATDTPREPEVFTLEEVAVKPDSVGENLPGFGEAPSVGARNITQNPLNTITNSESRRLISDATVWERSANLPNDYQDVFKELSARGDAGDAVAKGAMRFHEAIRSTGLADDFDRLWRSGSVVAKRLAYDLMESSMGLVRNNRSAAMLKEHYEKQLLGSFLPAYDDAWKLYAKERGLTWYDRMFRKDIQNEFNELILMELNGRAYDPPGTIRDVHPAVKAAADAHDKWSALDVAIGKGRKGEFSIKGYENIDAYSGYTPQKWSSSKIETLIRAGRKPKEIAKAIAEAYRMMHPGMSPKDSMLWADAVVRRARAIGTGADTNLIGMLRADGRGFLEDILKSNGIPQKDIDSLLDNLTSAAAERGQKGYTKSRIDVDMRHTAANGIRMLDLFETDLVTSVSRRARGTAGQAALARKGITSSTDRAAIKAAILDEQLARGPSHSGARNVGEKINDLIDEDKHLTAKDIDDLFSYFDAGPVGGGLSPIVSNIKRLTNLALLNGLGLTQLGETGAMIASVGIERWWDHAGAALKSAASDPKSALVQELKHMSVLVPEERLFRDDLNLDLNINGTTQTELMMRMDRGLGMGQRVQGYISGFYAVRNIQQRIAVTSAADKIMTNMKGLADDLSNVRAEDIGLDPKTFAKIKKYVDNGTVEFKDNALHKLNFDKWDPETVEDFAISLNRHVNQVVQKAMVGESNILFASNGIAALFFHLKSFPMLALEKQTMRHLRIADQEALATFFYGLATAATAYTVRQAVYANTQNLTPEKIAKGAIGYSNMTGWIPMWTDPVMGMFGFNDLRFNNYARGIDSNVFSTPAALSTLNRMANIPGAVINTVTGNMTNNDVRALQTTPLIGNAYGIGAILNSMKTTAEERAAKRKADAEAKAAEEAGQANKE